MNSGSYITECVGMLHLVRWRLVALLKDRGSSQFIPLISWNLTKLRDSEHVPIATVPSSVARNSRSQKKNENASDIMNDIIMLKMCPVRFPIWWKIWFQVLTFWPEILTYFVYWRISPRRVCQGVSSLSAAISFVAMGGRSGSRSRVLLGICRIGTMKRYPPGN